MNCNIITSHRLQLHPIQGASAPRPAQLIARNTQRLSGLMLVSSSSHDAHPPRFGASMTAQKLDRILSNASSGAFRVWASPLRHWHNLKKASYSHPIRRQPGLRSYGSVIQAVNGTGHRWCSLVKDLWSCSGERYRQVLIQTLPWVSGTVRRSLAAGTRVVIQGFSFLQQLGVYSLCEDARAIWKVGCTKGDCSNAAWYLGDFGSEIQMLQLSAYGILRDDIRQKDREFRLHVPRQAHLAALAAFVPNIFVVGLESDTTSSQLLENALEYARRWPKALLLPWLVPSPPYSQNERHCRAEFFGCGRGGGHQCMPGPVARNAEALWQAVAELQRTARERRPPVLTMLAPLVKLQSAGVRDSLNEHCLKPTWQQGIDCSLGVLNGTLR